LNVEGGKVEGGKVEGSKWEGRKVEGDGMEWGTSNIACGTVIVGVEAGAPLVDAHNDTQKHNAQT
jgi:hypothetical protein